MFLDCCLHNARIWLIWLMANIICLSWHSSCLWNVDIHPVVSTFCPRCGPAPRQIIRGRDLIFSHVLRSLFVSWIVEANCILCDIWQHPSVISCWVASAGSCFVDTHCHMGTILDGTVDSRVYIAVFCVYPLSSQPQFWNSSGLGESIHTAVNLFSFSLPLPLSSSNTICVLFVYVGKLLRCASELVMTVFQNLLS